MRTIKLVMLFIVIYSCLSSNLSAQKAAEYKVAIEYCRPARYVINGNSYAVKIVCGPEIMEQFQSKNCKKMEPLGCFVH